MEDKLLDKLLEMVAQRRPRWGRIIAQFKVNGITHVRGVKLGHQSSKELALRIEMLDMDRQIAKLTKAKPKAKKVSGKKLKSLAHK